MTPAESQPHDNYARLPLEELGLTVRAYAPLKRAGINTYGELIAHGEQDLLAIDRNNLMYVEEVKRKLAAIGLSLQQPPASPH
ncbi:DNA-directed RNA polymerase subunit alpha C-terminal domain-containing protein [Streptosporangium sp. NPDC002544]|uniref:DNA-directed RNA polymerase subunit alpha C-terminal domain-containing protein n=1 Tax=unclassified Streptosporangium TaxID=2632669 RepID=UPI0033256C9A